MRARVLAALQQRLLRSDVKSALLLGVADADGSAVTVHDLLIAPQPLALELGKRTAERNLSLIVLLACPCTF